jgi:hypothetical protein
VAPGGSSNPSGAGWDVFEACLHAEYEKVEEHDPILRIENETLLQLQWHGFSFNGTAISVPDWKNKNRIGIVQFNHLILMFFRVSGKSIRGKL